MRSSRDRVVLVRALAGDIVLCSWARLYSHSASLHPGVSMGTGDCYAGGYLAMDQHPIQGGVEILLVTSCYWNRDKLRSDGPHWPVCRLIVTSCCTFSHAAMFDISLSTLTLVIPDWTFSSELSLTFCHFWYWRSNEERSKLLRFSEVRFSFHWKCIFILFPC